MAIRIALLDRLRGRKAEDFETMAARVLDRQDDIEARSYDSCIGRSAVFAQE